MFKPSILTKALLWCAATQFLSSAVLGEPTAPLKCEEHAAGVPDAEIDVLNELSEEQALPLLGRESTLIIDVRRPEEFRWRRLKGSINVPHHFHQDERDKEFLDDRLDRIFTALKAIIESRPGLTDLFFYCRSGERSWEISDNAHTHPLMVALGVGRTIYVHNLEHGLNGWTSTALVVSESSSSAP